jgi:hypothetical protein
VFIASYFEASINIIPINFVNVVVGGAKSRLILIAISAFPTRVYAHPHFLHPIPDPAGLAI